MPVTMASPAYRNIRRTGKWISSTEWVTVSNPTKSQGARTTIFRICIPADSPVENRGVNMWLAPVLARMATNRTTTDANMVIPKRTLIMFVIFFQKQSMVPKTIRIRIVTKTSPRYTSYPANL